MKRPPVETYVRTSHVCGKKGLTIEPGVESRPDDFSFEFMTGVLGDICARADGEDCYLAPRLAERVAELIVSVWPDRAYFVEVHGDAGWIQIFQPYGVPRNADSPLARFARWLRRCLHLLSRKP